MVAVLNRGGNVRSAIPEGGKLIRCWQCHRTLLISFGFRGRIELNCKRCRSANVLKDDSQEIEIQDNRAVQVDAALRRRESLGFGENLRPTLMDIAEIMEQRWQEHQKRRAKRSVAIAVGLRFDVLMRDNFKCRYCGVSVEEGAMLHVDHVIPQVKGGLTEIDNLVTACLDCNLGKSDKSLT